MDERSNRDSTVLLAGYDKQRDCVDTVRAAFEVANNAIAARSAGVGAISEDVEIAQRQPDDVLR